MSPYRLLTIEVHKLLQQSECYAAYATEVVRRYTLYDIWTKWIVATASCAPFINQLRTSTANTATWYVALIPLVAIALPLVNFSKVIQIASELHGKHAELLPQMKKLYRDITTTQEYDPNIALLIDGWKSDLNDLDNRLSLIRTNKSGMPDIKSLKNKAERESEKFELPKFVDLPKITNQDGSQQLAQKSESRQPAVINYSKPMRLPKN